MNDDDASPTPESATPGDSSADMTTLSVAERRSSAALAALRALLFDLCVAALSWITIVILVIGADRLISSAWEPISEGWRNVVFRVLYTAAVLSAIAFFVRMIWQLIRSPRGMLDDTR